MDSKTFRTASPDKSLAAVSGLFCASSMFYIGSMEDPKKLERLAERFGRSIEDLTCHGCRSDTRSFYCKNYCKMDKCAEKGDRLLRAVRGVSL